MGDPRHCSNCGFSSKFSGGETIEVHGLCVSCYNRDMANSIDYVEDEIKSLIEKAEQDLQYVSDTSLARLSKWQRLLFP